MFSKFLMYTFNKLENERVLACNLNILNIIAPYYNKQTQKTLMLLNVLLNYLQLKLRKTDCEQYLTLDCFITFTRHARIIIP